MNTWNASSATTDRGRGMPRFRVWLLLAVALVLCLASARSEAGLFHRKDQGTPPPGKPRCIPNTFARAGYSGCPSSCAEFSNTPDYRGYNVGGGSACHGDLRTVEEGTWGWDYVGHCLPRKVSLGWSHGRRFQGGTGSYWPDGPQCPSAAQPRR
jgi:hypothetical protein